MTFLTWAALAIGALVAAPLLAHLLRRRPPRTEPFAAVRLVPPSPAVTRRRPAFEDRALLGLRVIAIVLLALLGATPFVKCERLSLARRGGASVALAIVLDDSLSMLAREREGPEWAGASRFERAHDAALELVEGLQPGDAAAIVLAGRPARVALGATTELAAAREVLAAVEPSHRSTDLEDAIARASEVLRPLPHVDKRIVLLSDMRDAEPGASALVAPDGVALWAPLEALRAPFDDCAVVRAELGMDRVLARVACATTDGEGRDGRPEGGAAVGTEPSSLPPSASAESSPAGRPSPEGGAASGAPAASSLAEPSTEGLADDARRGQEGASASKGGPEKATRVLQLVDAGRVLAEARVAVREGAFDVALPLSTTPAKGGDAGPLASSSAVASSEAREAAEPDSRGPAEPGAGGARAAAGPGLPKQGQRSLVVSLQGADAITEDDAAPVHDQGSSVRIGVVTDVATSRPPTGGPPPIEQALAALGLGGDMRYIATIPDQPEQLAELGVLMVDDVPGFTPEARRAVGAWLDAGGVMLLALGPRAAEAPLGTGFEPMVPGVVRWSRVPHAGSATAGAPPRGPGEDAGSARGAPMRTPEPWGLDPTSGALFGPTASGLVDLAPSGRTEIDARPGSTLQVAARWTDGKPLLFERRMGRGVCFVLTLPLSTDESDIALRPAFLVLLSHVVDTARGVGGASRSEVGTTWSFEGYDVVQARLLALRPGQEAQEVAVRTDSGIPELTPTRLGLYEIGLGDRDTRRVAVIAERELLATARRLPEEATASELGGVRSDVDISRYIALCLLVLVGLELAVRLWLGRSAAGRGASSRRR